MSAILATVDIEDLATPKVAAIKDALTDLSSHLAQLQTASSGAVSALGASTQATAAAAQGFKALAGPGGMGPLPPLLNNVTNGVQNYLLALGQAAAAAQQNIGVLQMYGGALVALNSQLTKGAQVTQLQANALQNLAQAAQQGNGFTTKQAAAMQQLAGQMQVGTVVTQQHTKALGSMAQGYAQVNGFVGQAASAWEGMRLQALAAAAAIGVLIAGLSAYLRSSVDLAARIETLGVVMGVTGKNAHISNFELRVQIEEVRSLGITTKEATEAVLQFVQAQLKVSDSGKLARAAQNLAVTAGIDSSQAFDRLLRAINTQQPELLRSFGIVTGMAQVMAKYAASVGKTVKEMDPLERKQAVLNLILAEGAKVNGAYEASMGTAGKMMGSMSRLTEELSLKLGQELLPGFSIVVKAVFELLTALIKMPAIFFELAAGIGVAVVALAALHGAMALQLIPTLIKLGGILLAHPIVLIFALAIGAATLAILHFTKATQITIEADAKASATAQTRIDRITELAKRLDEAKLHNDNSTAAVKELDAAYLALGREAPGAVERIDGAWVVHLGVLEKVKAAEKERQKEMYITAKAQLDQLERDRAALVKELDDLGARRTAIQASADAIKKRMASGQYVSGEDVQSLGAAANFLKDIQGSAVKAEAGMSALDAEMSRFAPIVQGMGEAWSPALANIGAYERAQSALDAQNKAFPENAERVIAAVNKLGISLDVLKEKGTGAADAEIYQKLLENITKALQQIEEQDKKALAAKAKYTQAYESALDSIRGTSSSTTATLAAANQAFKEVAAGSDEYRSRLLKGTAAMALYNKATEAQKKQFPEVGRAIAAVQALELAESIKGWTKAAEDASKAFDDFIAGSIEGLQRQGQAMAAQLDVDLYTQQMDTIQRVEAMDRDSTERRLALTEDAVDRALRLEKQRVDDVILGIKREREAREVAFKFEAEQLHVRYEMMRLEAARRAQDYKDRISQEVNLLAVQLDRRVKAGEINQKFADDNMAAFRVTAGLQTQQIDAQLALYNKQLDAAEQYEAALLDRRQEAARDNDVLVDAAVERMKEASKATTAQIIVDHDFLFQTLTGVYGQIAEGALSGFARILTGAESVKDGLKGIWDSIKSTFFSFVDSLIKKWVDGFVQSLVKKQTTSVMTTLTNGVISTIANSGAGGAGGAGGASDAVFDQFTGQQTAAGGGSQASSLVGAAFNFKSFVSSFKESSAKMVAMGKTLGLLKSVPAGTGVGGSSVMATAAGGILIGGAVGGLVGYGVGHKTGSTTKGVLAGAASGGLAGGAVSGWNPYAIAGGAVIGAVAGWWGARKQKQEMKEYRDQLIAAQGGLEAFKKTAREAGVDVNKLLNSKKVEEMDAEVEKLNTVMKLGGLDVARKRLNLLGIDLNHVLGMTGKKAQEEMKRIDGVLAEQEKRMAGLEKLASGFASRGGGFISGLGKDMQEIYATLGPKVRATLETAFKKAVDNGFSGDAMAFLTKTLKDINEGGANIFDIPVDALELFNTLLVTAQADFDRLGQYASATFAGILKETGDINAAMEAIGPTLDLLIEAQDQFGFSSSTSFGKLLEFRKMLKVNEDVAMSLSGITQILTGLKEAGALTAEMFVTLGSDATAQYDKLIARGVDADMAMLAMQPTLQKLWEQHKATGWLLDANTQKLIDQAEAQGLVGTAFQDTNAKILDVLNVIADLLGREIPEAAGRTIDAFEDTGRYAQPRIDAISQGHSPGGLKEIPLELRKSVDAMGEFRAAVAKDSTAIDTDVTDIQRRIGAVKDTTSDDTMATAMGVAGAGGVGDALGVGALGGAGRSALGGLFGFGGGRRSGSDRRTIADIINGVPRETPPVLPEDTIPIIGEDIPVDQMPQMHDGPGGPMIQMGDINIDASALDAEGMEVVFREKIVPLLQQSLDSNVGQFASVMEAKLARYRR